MFCEMHNAPTDEQVIAEVWRSERQVLAKR